MPRLSSKMAGFLCVTAAAALAAISACSSERKDAPDHAGAEWPVYGGNAAGDRFSNLTQITKANVSGLQQAWRYDMGVGGLQTTPLMIDGTLYALTPEQNVVALDPVTGREKWRRVLADAAMQPVRGLTFWTDGRQRRLFANTGWYLSALDPETGQPLRRFGEQGRIDLRVGLGDDPEQVAVVMTSPGVIFGDLIITGFRTTEANPAASGAIRAYEVRTGQLRWTFNVIPRPGQTGHESWPADAWKKTGGGNNWAGMVVDTARGIVYAPTGSATDDFYGGDRLGSNLYASSLLALDAKTGRRLWHRQIVHHDIWDRDPPSPPVLLTLKRNGRSVDAVAQATKHGFLFVFDRVTGKPLFPIEERPVPASDTPGEQAWPTQPFPTAPAPFARQQLTADMLTRRSPTAAAAARRDFAAMRSGGQFIPLSVGKQTVIFPGFDGGAEWGGQAIDPVRGVIYLNSTDVAWTGGLAVAAGDQAGPGAAVYEQNCAGCHGVDRTGNPPAFPSLVGVLKRRSEEEVRHILAAGRGRMPSFAQLKPEELSALLDLLRGTTPAAPDGRELKGIPGGGTAAGRYVFTGYKKFLDPDGYPAVAPPWGTLNAIDLNTGRYLWKIPLGEYPELAARGQGNTGTENYGGPILTKSGVLFIGATVYDRKLRAFDASNGKLLWQGALPFAGTATPITYEADGRQFVVIATSGERDPKGPQGSAYVAYALPEKK